MFEQIPRHEAYSRDPFGSSQVRDYKHMLQLFNVVLRRAPLFNDRELVGLPINAILDWPMGTPSGIAAFLNEKVNAQFKKMLDVWSDFLTSKESAYVINESQTGWLGLPARTAMRVAASSGRRARWTFETTFVCNPSIAHFGYDSWDDFFTRRFWPGVRPVAFPNYDSVIISACEAAPYRIYRHVRRLDTFWVKAQKYSLLHMLAHDPLASSFIGGTIYQSFLDAVNYHRWHSPVTGTVVKAYVQPGTYYSQTLVNGFPLSDTHSNSKHSQTSSISSNPSPRTKCSVPDPGAPYMSQAYTTAVATRAIIFIEADNPAIGLICVLPVGMAEVSTCEITVRAGQRLAKGDELGMFHFGGSTCCLLFRSGLDLRFDMHGQEGHIGLGARNIPVNSRIATVVQVKRKEDTPRRKPARMFSLPRDEHWRCWREESFGRQGF